MRGKGIDYFENSRRATLSQRTYASTNPVQWSGYGADAWGLTASDGPLDSTFVVDGRTRTFHTYWARGVGTDEMNDDGTLVPTAAGGSVPFAPEAAIPTLVAMRERYGEPLFGRYGFVDAFNPDAAYSRSAAASRAHRVRASRGSIPTTSASIRGRSSRWWRTGAAASSGR